eukprot:15839_1
MEYDWRRLTLADKDNEAEEYETDLSLHEVDTMSEGAITQKRNQYKRVYRSYICCVLSILSIGVILSGLKYGAYKITVSGALNEAIACNETHENDENKGLCELISRNKKIHNSCTEEQQLSYSQYCATIYTIYYSFKIVDNCDEKMPCNLYEIFDIHEPSEMDEEYVYNIGQVYPCVTNNECNHLYLINKSSHLCTFNWLYLIAFLYYILCC